MKLTEAKPVFSGIAGCPLDKIMREDGVHRWMAIALYMSELGLSFHAVGKILGYSSHYVSSVAKGKISNPVVSEAIAKACDLPESQVFPKNGHN